MTQEEFTERMTNICIVVLIVGICIGYILAKVLP